MSVVGCNFFVVQFLELPYQGINEYAIVPRSWFSYDNMKIELGAEAVVFYPRENPTVTLNRVKYQENLDGVKCEHYVVMVKYATYTYEDADNCIGAFSGSCNVSGDLEMENTDIENDVSPGISGEKLSQTVEIDIQFIKHTSVKYTNSYRMEPENEITLEKPLISRVWGNADELYNDDVNHRKNTATKRTSLENFNESGEDHSNKKLKKNLKIESPFDWHQLKSWIALNKEKSIKELTSETPKESTVQIADTGNNKSEFDWNRSNDLRSSNDQISILKKTSLVQKQSTEIPTRSNKLKAVNIVETKTVPEHKYLVNSNKETATTSKGILQHSPLMPAMLNKKSIESAKSALEIISSEECYNYPNNKISEIVQNNELVDRQAELKACLDFNKNQNIELTTSEKSNELQMPIPLCQEYTKKTILKGLAPEDFLKGITTYFTTVAEDKTCLPSKPLNNNNELKKKKEEIFEYSVKAHAAENSLWPTLEELNNYNQCESLPSGDTLGEWQQMLSNWTALNNITNCSIDLENKLQKSNIPLSNDNKIAANGLSTEDHVKKTGTSSVKFAILNSAVPLSNINPDINNKNRTLEQQPQPDLLNNANKVKKYLKLHDTIHQITKKKAAEKKYTREIPVVRRNESNNFIQRTQDPLTENIQSPFQISHTLNQLPYQRITGQNIPDNSSSMALKHLNNLTSSMSTALTSNYATAEPFNGYSYPISKSQSISPSKNMIETPLNCSNINKIPIRPTSKSNTQKAFSGGVRSSSEIESTSKLVFEENFNGYRGPTSNIQNVNGVPVMRRNDVNHFIQKTDPQTENLQNVYRTLEKLNRLSSQRITEQNILNSTTPGISANNSSDYTYRIPTPLQSQYVAAQPPNGYCYPGSQFNNKSASKNIVETPFNSNYRNNIAPTYSSKDVGHIVRNANNRSNIAIDSTSKYIMGKQNNRYNDPTSNIQIMSSSNFRDIPYHYNSVPRNNTGSSSMNVPQMSFSGNSDPRNNISAKSKHAAEQSFYGYSNSRNNIPMATTTTYAPQIPFNGNYDLRNDVTPAYISKQEAEKQYNYSRKNIAMESTIKDGSRNDIAISFPSKDVAQISFSSNNDLRKVISKNFCPNNMAQKSFYICNDSKCNIPVVSPSKCVAGKSCNVCYYTNNNNNITHVQTTSTSKSVTETPFSSVQHSLSGSRNNISTVSEIPFVSCSDSRSNISLSTSNSKCVANSDVINNTQAVHVTEKPFHGSSGPRNPTAADSTSKVMARTSVFDTSGSINKNPDVSISKVMSGKPSNCNDDSRNNVSIKTPPNNQTGEQRKQYAKKRRVDTNPQLPISMKTHQTDEILKPNTESIPSASGGDNGQIAKTIKMYEIEANYHFGQMISDLMNLPDNSELIKKFRVIINNYIARL